MKAVKKNVFFCLLVLIVISLAFTACGVNETLSVEGGTDVIGDTLKVGMSCDNAPFGWIQEEEGEDTMPLTNGEGYAGGYDVQIARIIGEELDVKINIVLYDRGDLLDALEDGEIDLMISGVNPLESRKDKVDFSDAYYENDYVVIVLKDGAYANAVKISDFKKARLTASNGSYIYDELLPQMDGVKIMQPLTYHADMRVALGNDVIDGYVTTRPEGMSATRLHPEFAMIAFSQENGFETDDENSTVAVGVTKGRDFLLAAVNGALETVSDADRKAMMDRAVYAEPENLDDADGEDS